MIAIIVPAHNEQDLLAACLESAARAAAHPELLGEAVSITVVLDACTDRSSAIAHGFGAAVVTVQFRNVGAARAAGARAALKAGARWLAFTDADTTVSADWLVAQLALRADVVCGTIAVAEWGDYGERMCRHFAATYTDADGHRHIHGANLAMSAQAYLRAGGFEALPSSEDVRLVQALRDSGACIAWSAAPRVHTSARKIFRAPAGFGATLRRVDDEACASARTGAL